MEILEAFVIAFISMASAEGATECMVSDPHFDHGPIHAHVLCERGGYKWKESVIGHNNGEPIIFDIANGRMS